MTTSLRFPSGKMLPAVCMLAASFFTTNLTAQTPQQRTCHANDILLKEMAADPARAERLEQIESHTARFLKNNMASAATGVITIPVVVHVLYNNSTENISDAQIQSQMQVLNDDFRRLNADRDNTWSQAADVEIEFALATVDPNGNATNGITRTFTNTTSFSADNNNMKFSSSGGKDAWPAGSYLNMWVCDLGGGILGFAQFPGGSASTDGVVMGYKYFGTTGTATAPFDKGRTTTHEVGHWLNLRHIWGDGGCSVDDYVSDTPLSDAANYGCSVGHVSCNTVDMVQNYMDYSDDACMNLFTLGQKNRMRALFNSGGARESLLSSGGLGGGGTPPPTACSENELNLKLVLDNYPAETSWQLKNSSGSVVASGSGYSSANATVNESFCLADGTYSFTINDSYGDGICCSYGNGSYTLTNASGTVLASGGSFGSSETKSFSLGGGGSTPPPTYCASKGNNASDEWINRVIFAGINNTSGNNGGYRDYTSLSGNVNAGSSYSLTIYPAWASTVYSEGYNVWIDWNQDGDFTDSGEAVYSRTKTTSSTISGTINVPSTAKNGGTRMRVSMKYNGNATSCESFTYGEVEDYTINVSGGSARDAVASRVGEPAPAISLYPNPNTSGELHVQLQGYGQLDARIFDMTGRQVWKGTLDAQNSKLNISGFPNGMYTLRANTAEGETLSSKFIKQ